jgi:hypothetical protein
LFFDFFLNYNLLFRILGWFRLNYRLLFNDFFFIDFFLRHFRRQLNLRFFLDYGLLN